jgi:ABC-type multidrug transport system ATPase subunit
VQVADSVAPEDDVVDGERPHVLVVRGLRKSLGGRPVVRGVDLDIRSGEIVALVGPNGAGKTTLVSTVAGVRTPDAGTISVAGARDGPQRGDVRRRIGYAPQELGVYPTLTADGNLRFFGQLYGVPADDLDERIGAVARQLRLAPLLPRRVEQLSLGEQKRLHTAAALLHRPELLLLDEPTTGADVETRAAVLEAVRGLAGEGAGVLYVTHYLREVEELGASVVMIDDGEVRARGSVGDLVRDLGTAAVVLTFDGPAPPSPLADVRATVDGDVLTVFAADPAGTAAELMQALDDAARARLVNVELLRPGLDSVYLAVLGRHSDAPGPGGNAP